MRVREALTRLLEHPEDPALLAEALERVAHHLNNPLGTATIEAWNLARALDRVDRALTDGDPEAAQSHLGATRATLANLIDAQSELKRALQQVQQAAEDLEDGADGV